MEENKTFLKSGNEYVGRLVTAVLFIVQEVMLCSAVAACCSSGDGQHKMEEIFKCLKTNNKMALQRCSECTFDGVAPMLSRIQESWHVSRQALRSLVKDVVVMRYLKDVVVVGQGICKTLSPVALVVVVAKGSKNQPNVAVTI